METEQKRQKEVRSKPRKGYASKNLLTVTLKRGAKRLERKYVAVM